MLKAIDTRGQPVYASDLKPAVSLWCPHCGELVTHVAGYSAKRWAESIVMPPHFRHRQGSRCSLASSQSPEHMWMKMAIKARFPDAELEKNLIAHHRADVVFSDGDRQIAVECQATAISAVAAIGRTRAYSENAVPTWWAHSAHRTYGASLRDSGPYRLGAEYKMYEATVALAEYSDGWITTLSPRAGLLATRSFLVRGPLDRRRLISVPVTSGLAPFTVFDRRSLLVCASVAPDTAVKEAARIAGLDYAEIVDVDAAVRMMIRDLQKRYPDSWLVHYQEWWLRAARTFASGKPIRPLGARDKCTRPRSTDSAGPQMEIQPITSLAQARRVCLEWLDRNYRAWARGGFGASPGEPRYSDWHKEHYYALGSLVRDAKAIRYLNGAFDDELTRRRHLRSSVSGASPATSSDR